MLRLDFGEDHSFSWSMWAASRAWPGPHNRVCLLVGLVGPLVHLPNGAAMGPGTGDDRCGPIKSGEGVAVTMPTKEGSITPPSGSAEPWEAFDVGIAAYPPSVGQVRLIFSDGATEILKTRSVPGRLAFKDAEPFRYAVFAYLGCVRELQGLAKGKVVARAIQHECETQ